jgi:hypothetical protein
MAFRCYKKLKGTILAKVIKKQSLREQKNCVSVRYPASLRLFMAVEKRGENQGKKNLRICAGWCNQEIF